MRPSTILGIALTGGLAACGQSTPNTQAAENASAEDMTATEVGTNAAGSPAAEPTEPGTNEVSSGMPVPGTNTPEHIVVKDTGNNAS